MALNALGLGFVFTAQDLASGKINHIARSFGNMDNAAVRSSAAMQRNFAQLGAGALVLGGGMAALMGGFRLAGVAGQFTQEVARVGRVAQASAADVQLLHDAAIRVGATTQFSPTQAIAGLGDLAQAGLNAQESLAALNGTLAYAAGGQVEVTTAATAITSALKVFRLDASQAGLVADQFLRITNSTALSAGDMEQAMGSVARGAISANQRIEEMLPAIGLVRNTGVDVSVAAQSVSSALVFMASRAEKFRDLGVSITNADGSFRPFMDIVHETAGVLETRFPNAAERAAQATELFSRFGLQAYTGVSQQLAQGVRDSAGNLHRGADAIAFLRSEMQNATGSAEEFRDALMDTFEGRKAELASATETLGVILGEGFEVAWKPVVEFIRDGVRQLVAFFQELPVSVRGNIATFITFAGAAATLFGTFIAGKAIFALVAPFIGSMTAALGGLLTSLLPVVLAFGALVAVGYTIQRHFSRGTESAVAFSRGVNQIKLAFSGLMQLIGTGSLSGSVLEELNRAENSGVKRFIANIYSFGFRIMQFFRGIGIGFNAAIDAMGPTLDRAGAAFSRLWGYVSMIFGGAGSSLVEGGSARYIEAGSAIGDFLGGLVEVIIDVATAVANFATGFIGGFQTVVSYMQPAFAYMVREFSGLWDQIVAIGRTLGIVGEETGSAGGAFETFGQIIGGIAGGALGALAGTLGFIARVLRIIIDVATWGVRKIVQLFDFFGDLGISIAQVMLNVKLSVLDLVDTAIVAMGELMSAIPAGMRPALANDAIVAGVQARGRITTRAIQRTQINQMADGLRNEIGGGDGPSNAEARANAANTTATVAASIATAQLLARQAQQRQGAAPNQTINLVVDGQVLATASAAANANTNERSFRPTGGSGDD